MIEPLSNGIHACKRAGIGPGKTVAILGAGPMGYLPPHPLRPSFCSVPPLQVSVKGSSCEEDPELNSDHVPYKKQQAIWTLQTHQLTIALTPDNLTEIQPV